MRLAGKHASISEGIINFDAEISDGARPAAFAIPQVRGSGQRGYSATLQSAALPLRTISSTALLGYMTQAG